MHKESTLIASLKII